MAKTLEEKIQTALDALDRASAELERQVAAGVLDRDAAHILIVPAQCTANAARNAYFKKIKGGKNTGILPIDSNGKIDFARMHEDFARDVKEDKLFKEVFPSHDRFSAALNAFASGGGCEIEGCRETVARIVECCRVN